MLFKQRIISLYSIMVEGFGHEKLHGIGDLLLNG